MALPAQAEAAEKETMPQQDSGKQEGSDERGQDCILEGETEEESLQRRIEEGNVGKGKTLRRWKATEEKQRRVETWRHESKVQRYGQIYEEVRALRKETRHSVQDLRERFKEKGVIQNKDQFIVRLIAQERNEQEGKVAAIKSLQQWRLTDVELHNFINRCHKKGIAGKLDLAMQWAFEQEEAGGEVNFKEGLAFYSSIGILQPRSSAHTQQQWREWREWEDAMTSALVNRKPRGEDSPLPEGAEPAGPDASCNEDSTVCNSPWSSERGGGGSFGGFSGSMRASSAHGEGDVAAGSLSRFRSGTAPEASKDRARLSLRGRTPANRESPKNRNEWWNWRSYSPPSSLARRKSADLLRKASADKKAAASLGGGLAVPAPADGGIGKPPPSPLGVEPPDGAGGAAGTPVESVVRSSGGYLPPRHRLAGLQVSPSRPASNGEPGAVDAGALDLRAESGYVSEGEGVPTPRGMPSRRGLKSRGVARTRAKGPVEGSGSPQLAIDPQEEEGPAPTEEMGTGTGRRRVVRDPPRRSRTGGEEELPLEARSRSLSGVFSGLADWLMPGMEGGPHRLVRVESGSELILDVYPRSPHTPDEGPTGIRSAPVTPRGRPRPSSVLRDGGWFYNGDSDYSTEEEDTNFESEDEGFWADAGTMEPPRKIGGGGGLSILKRLRRLFTGL